MRICRGCQRHVKGEAACPFCGGGEFDGTPQVARRLSRGAMIGAAAVAIACSSTGPGDDAGTDVGAQPAYGAVVDAAAIDAAMKDAAPDTIVAAYGGPILDGGDQ